MINTRLLSVGLSCMIASTILGLIAISAHGQNMTMAARLNASLPSIAGLNAQNIQNYQLNLGKTTDIARLHNASSATIAVFENQKQVLSCVDLHFSYIAQSSIQSCDDLLTGYLVNNELGGNQTMINIAKAYLNLSGIR